MNTQTKAPEPGAVDAQIVQGAATQILEMRSQQDFAIAHPRDEVAVLKRAMAELEIAPEFAQTAFYVIPFENKRTGEKNNVEGPSIKAAMALQRHWRNSASGTRVVSEDDDRLVVEGVFIDRETNTVVQRQKVVPKFLIDWKTKLPKPLNAQRLAMAIDAGMSKSVRNAILGGLPVWLVDRYFQAAKTLAAKNVGKKSKTDKDAPIDERYAWLYNQLKKKGVTQKQVETYIKENMDANLSKDEILGQMIGIYNAIKDGQTNINEVVGVEGKEKSDTSSKDGGVKTEDLL